MLICPPSESPRSPGPSMPWTACATSSMRARPTEARLRYSRRTLITGRRTSCLRRWPAGPPPGREISLKRDAGTRPVAAHGGDWIAGDEALVWAEVIQSARQSARVVAKYLAFMAIAGCHRGVRGDEPQPDLGRGRHGGQPRSLADVRRLRRHRRLTPRLVARAIAALVIGLTLTGVAGWAMTLPMKAIDYPPLRAGIGDGGLGSLPTINASPQLPFPAAIRAPLDRSRTVSSRLLVG